MNARAATPAALVGAGMLCLAAGCTVDQASEVRTYREVLSLDGAGQYTAPGPLSLRDAVLIANAQNERLSIEGETYLQALIERQRRFASLLPTIDLFGEATIREKAGATSDSSNGGGGTSRDTTLFDAGINGQYSLLTGLTDLRRVNAAAITGEQRRWLLLDLRESLLLETARAYYGVLLAERQVRVLESSLDVQIERLRLIRGQREVGMARPLDVAQIEAQASDTRSQLIDASNAVRQQRLALELLTGLDLREASLSDGFDPGEPFESDDAAHAVALAGRQDLAAAVDQARAARAQVDAQIGRYYPSVSVDLDYFLTRDTTPTDRDWSALLAIRFPLFSAGSIDADVRTAWSQFRQAILNHSLIKRQVDRDVRGAAADLTATRQLIQELRVQVDAAREALRQAEAAFGAGLGTNLERITAQDQLLSSELRLAGAEYNAKIAHLALMRAAGHLASAFSTTPIPAPPPTSDRAVPTSPFVILPTSTGAPSTAGN